MPGKSGQWSAWPLPVQGRAPPPLSPALLGAVKRMGGLTVRSRPRSPPSPDTGRPEPRGPGTRALGGTATLQPGSRRLLSLVPPPAERPWPCLPTPRTLPASPGGRQAGKVGGPGIRVLCRRAHVVARSRRPRSPADAWRRRGPPSGGGGGRSGEPPGRGSRAGHSPQPGYDAVEGVTHQSGPPLGAAAAAEGPRWRRWPGPEAPPLSAPRPPAGKDLRGEVAARQPAAAYPPRPRPPRPQSGSCRAPHRSLALQPRLRRPPPTFRPRPDVQSQPAHFLICVPSSLKGLKYAGLRAATYPGQ